MYLLDIIKMLVFFFENLNEHFGPYGQHAENNSEFYIPELGYYLDYYEKDLTWS